MVEAAPGAQGETARDKLPPDPGAYGPRLQLYLAASGLESVIRQLEQAIAETTPRGGDDVSDG